MIYKALNPNLQAAHGGDYKYPGLGRWTRHLDGELIPCEYGYHVTQGSQVFGWLAPVLYEAEICPDHARFEVYVTGGTPGPVEPLYGVAA